MSKPIVYSTRVFLPEPMQRAAQQFDFTVNTADLSMTHAQIMTVAQQDIQAFLCSSGDDFGTNTIEALPDTVKCISTVSVGYDHIDITACKQRGIRVGNTPGVLDNATADIGWLCLLGAARMAQYADRTLRNGRWKGFEPGGTFVGTELSGKRLGILGMGSIGRTLAKRSQGWDMQVHYHNRNRLPAALENGAIYHKTPESLFAVSDFLSLNCPLTPTTENIINASTLALLPKGAVVVNTARGGVVDDDDLIAALQSGHILAAGLDVFNNEPHFDKRYLDLNNVFLLPHIGSATVEARTAMGNIAVDNIASALAGTDMVHEV